MSGDVDVSQLPEVYRRALGLTGETSSTAVRGKGGPDSVVFGTDRQTEPEDLGLPPGTVIRSY